MTPLPPLTPYILPGCYPHINTLVKVSKNAQMNFPYHTEFVSQHVNHFQPNFGLKKGWKNVIFSAKGVGTPLLKFREHYILSLTFL